MSYRSHTAASLIFSAALLFSFYNTHGQALATNDPNHRLKPSESRPITPATAANKLPFEPSVIIYYGGPNKPTPASPDPRSAAVPSSIRSKPVANAQQTKCRTAISSSKSDVSKPDLILSLQPIVISYRISAPVLFSNNPSLKTAKPNSTTTTTAFADDSQAKRASESPDPQRKVNSTAIPLPVQNEPPNAVAKPLAIEHRSGVDGASPVAVDNTKGEKTKFPTVVPTLGSEPVSEFVSAVDRGGAAADLKETKDATAVAEKTTETAAVKQEPVIEAPAAAEQLATKPKADTEISNTSKTVTVPSVSTVSEKPPNEDASTVSSENQSSSTALAGTGTASAASPNSVVSLNNTAVRLTLESHYPEAEDLLRKAIAENASVAKFHRNLSIVLERMNRFDEALAEARIAEKLSPSNPAVLEQLCMLELAKGSTPVAANCFEKLDSITPLDAVSQAYYGTALFRLGKMDEALAILEKAAKSAPPVAAALNALGVVYFTKKRFDDASAAFKNAVEADPDLSELRFNLAVAELACKNKSAALSQYNILKKDNSKLADQLYQALFSDKVVNIADLKTGKR